MSWLDGLFILLHGLFTWAISGAPESYPVLFLVVALGEIGFVAPFIMEGLFLSVGIQVAGGDLWALRLFLITLPAGEAGAAVVYWLARAGKAPILHIALQLLHIRVQQVGLVQHWLRRAGLWPVAFGRLIPGLTIPVSFISGVLRLPYPQFFGGVLLANVVWSAFFLALGIALRLGIGGIQPSAENDLNAFKLGFGVIAAVVLFSSLLYAFWRPKIVREEHKQAKATTEERNTQR
ncbi:MAG: VTT domain-containing protein [Chloroflexi bacterium]|nr:VTT domain-containing protein [Chloroflexota bacterium]